MNPSRKRKNAKRDVWEKGGHHTERGKGIWERVGGHECRFGCGATTLADDDTVSEVGGRGKAPNAVDGVFGEIDRSDPEGELVKSVVASSSSSESLHLEEPSSSSSSSSSSCGCC